MWKNEPKRGSIDGKRGTGINQRVMGKMQVIQPHVRTTKSSWLEIISGTEKGLTNLFQKYLRAYYVLGKNVAHRGRVS